MEIKSENNIRYYSGDITPGEGIVMVFGSNPEGRHGAGAAKVARERFGAVYGQGEGLQGNAYALPTKDLRVKENRSLRSISPEAITENIKRLYDTARQNPEKSFCIAYRNTDRQSLNGYTGIEMMRMFAAAGPLPQNIIVSEEWFNAGKEILSYELFLSLDELLNFHSGSIGQYVDDNLATANRPSREVMGDALSNTVRDALERGDNPAFVRLWAERAMKENDMTEEQRAVAEDAVKSIILDDDIVLGSDGKPLVLWHGSPAEFDEFDFSHAGDNTGLVEYTDRQTGEKVVSDSDKAIFFTDNRELAISYGFLARTQELNHLIGLMTDFISCLRDPVHPMADHIKSKKDLIEAVQILRRENDAELNKFLDRLPDLAGESPISSMDANTREELRNALIPIRTRYRGYWDLNRNGGISNQLNNFVRMKDYLPYFAENFDRLCEGDTTVMTEHEDDFNHYKQGFYSSEGRIGISIFIGPDNKELKVAGFKEDPVLLKTLSPDQRKEILQRIEDDLNACIEKYNAELEESGYRKHTHLYPVLLKAKNPLEHDYQESAFPDKYKPNEKYDTAYIAARQVKKALADGNDAVVYRNIRDPFLGDTYGVFSNENIVMLDRSLLPEERLDSTLGRVSGTVQRYMEFSNPKVDCNTNTIVIYHSRDWDGWTSGELALEAERKANPGARIDTFGWTYGDALPDVSGYDRVILVDLTISEKTELGPDYSWMKENAGKLVWIDHHKNAIEALPELKDIPGMRNTDGTLSACRLVWTQYHQGEDEPGHVKYVGLSDIQKRDDPEFPAAADYVLYLNRTYGRDVTLEIARDVMAADIDRALEKGKEFEMERAAHEEEVWSEGIVIEHKGQKGILLANGEQPSVVLKNHLMSSGDVDFVVLYQPISGEKGQYKCSIRVPEGKDFDGAAYAAQWGGGGHKAAAGWVFDEKELNKIMNNEKEIMETDIFRETVKENETKVNKHSSAVSFIEDDSPYYKERTRKNAEAADVTIAFAADFNTAGEKCTKNVAGDRYIAISLPPRDYFKEPETKFSKDLLKKKAETLEAAIMVLSKEHGFLHVSVNVNVAGNGLYTLSKEGISQADVDRFVTDVFRLIEKRPNVHVHSIRSGGQTGIDEAGIKAAVELGIQATVLAPQGWKFRDANGNDISDEKAFKARFPEGPVKDNGMKPISEKEMKTIQGGVEMAPQQTPQPVDPFRRIAETAVSSGKVKSVGELKDGWALVQANTGQFNFANERGQFMTKKWFDSATDFNNGFATIKRDGCTARINRDGIAVEVVNNIAQRAGNSPKI